MGEHGSKMSRKSMLTIESSNKKYHRFQIGQSPLVDIKNHCEPVMVSQNGEFSEDFDEEISSLPTKSPICGEKI